MVSSRDEDAEWEWVQAPYNSLSCSEDENELFCEENEDADASTPPTPAGLHIWEATRSESLSSTASSPVFKHGVLATVMAKERLSAIGPLHCSVSEWIEPQLVFLEPHGLAFRGFEIYNLVTYLQNTPKAKEALLSLLSDKIVWDAVMGNTTMRKLASGLTDEGLEEAMDSSIAADTFLYAHGKQACMLLKRKLSRAVDILLSTLGVHGLEKRVLDELDATVKSCILLVAILVFLVIGKRSSEGTHLSHTSV